MTNARLATHQHCRCYYRLRSFVRWVFWTGAFIAVLLVCGWLDSTPEF
jgi:hypothetical protein